MTEFQSEFLSVQCPSVYQYISISTTISERPRYRNRRNNRPALHAGTGVQYNAMVEECYGKRGAAPPPQGIGGIKFGLRTFSGKTGSEVG